MPKNTEEDGRQYGEFSEEEGKIHVAGIKIIRDGLGRGLGFDEACTGLEVIDPAMRRVIIDDYLKVTIAERHFQGEESLEDIAASLKVPAQRLEEMKVSMLAEVKEAAVEFYRKQAGDADFDMDDMGKGKPPGETSH
jgi:hypothetical protein